MRLAALIGLALAACHPAPSGPAAAPDEDARLNAAAAHLDTSSNSSEQP